MKDYVSLETGCVACKNMHTCMACVACGGVWACVCVCVRVWVCVCGCGGVCVWGGLAVCVYLSANI